MTQINDLLPGGIKLKVKLVHATQDGESLIAYMARVSNPENQDNPDSTKLIRYLIKHKHWSPFEMVSACFEIETTRDIGRQILRHRSFHFQEYSGRYSEMTKLGGMVERECRMQDAKNRQNSLETSDVGTASEFAGYQKRVWREAQMLYSAALQRGIAKEQARALLPEGLTPSRMYMHGTLRDWIHYIEVRADAATQKEHREIAEAIKAELYNVFPSIMEAAFNG